MELNFLVTGAHEVVDDVRGRGVTAGTAEPLVARQTFGDTALVVDAAVAAEASQFYSSK